MQNFDDVLVPPDHVSRSYNDTYYINTDTVLRTHTSAHQAQKLRDGCTHFLVTGDVYRRDSIDATHYPVFHQVCFQGNSVLSEQLWIQSFETLPLFFTDFHFGDSLRWRDFVCSPLQSGKLLVRMVFPLLYTI